MQPELEKSDAGLHSVGVRPESVQQGVGPELRLRGGSPTACLCSPEGENNSLNKCQEGSHPALLETRRELTWEETSVRDYINEAEF